MKPFIHEELASGRWHTFTLAFQLANVGADFGRALKGKMSGDNARMWSALERCLELLDLTIADPKHRKRLKELCRLREVICDFCVGDILDILIDLIWRDFHCVINIFPKIVRK